MRNGSHTIPKPPSKLPSGEVAPNLPSGQLYEQWVKYFGQSASTYASLFDDMSSRVAGGSYSIQDGMADSTKVWAQLAADWTAAFNYGMESMGEISNHGIDAGMPPPGAPRDQARGSLRAWASGSAAIAEDAAKSFGLTMPMNPGAVLDTVFGAAAAPGTGDRATATEPVPPGGDPSGTGPVGARPAAGPEATIVPVQGLRPTDTLVISDLTSIEAGGAVIPADAIEVSVTALDDKSYGAHVVATDAVVAPGLYLGQLSRPDGAVVASVQLYVARASGPA